MPNLPIHKASYFGPLDAVVAIEQLLSRVGGSKSERLCQLHRRLRQVPAALDHVLPTLEYPKEEDHWEESYEPH